MLVIFTAVDETELVAKGNVFGGEVSEHTGDLDCQQVVELGLPLLD